MKPLGILGALLAGLVAVSVSPADAKDIWPPPAKYDSGPLINAEYQTPIIKNLPRAQLTIACQGRHLACSYAEIGAPCYIFLPTSGWERMLRHEMGHCRGWSANHTG